MSGSAGSTPSAAAAEPQLEEQPDWVKAVQAEAVAVTYWFDPGERGKPYTARIRFSGRRLGVEGKPEPGDRFERVEAVAGIVPGSGPVSVTCTVVGINPGEWEVSADPLVEPSRRHAPAGGRPRPLQIAQRGPGAPSLLRSLVAWGTPAMSPSLPGRVRSRLRPFAPVPGSIFGVWPGLVLTGVLVGLVLQTVLLRRAHVDALAALGISVAAALAGLIGAKVWFVVISRNLSGVGMFEGMCIQGFIVGATVVLTAGLALSHFPIGTFLDATTPGLFLGMAIGRPACFVTGCCAGRPTASRWGLWGSDRRIGARRVPIQLWEAFVCLVIGIVTLVLATGPTPKLPGAIFVGGLATYTLARQILFQFRIEPRRSPIFRPTVTALAGLVLAADVFRWVVSSTH